MGLKLNFQTGKFDFVNDNNFSFNNIPEDSYLRIPENQQMLVYKELVNNGDIQNDGDLVIFETTDNRKSITTATTNLALNAENYNILVDASSDNIDITLPSDIAYIRKEYNIKKIDTSGNFVNVIGTIDNGVNAILTDQNESITIQFDGSKWWII